MEESAQRDNGASGGDCFCILQRTHGQLST